MTYREALIIAVDELRALDRDDLRLVAKKLEEKVHRLRAREEKSFLMLSRCFCGQRKEKEKTICEECHAVVPAKLMLDFMTADHRTWPKIKQQIRSICIGRSAGESEAA